MNSNNNQIGFQWKPSTRQIVEQQRQKFTEENSIDENGISLCIRFAFKNITPEQVFDIMENPKIIGENNCESLGTIERIDYIIRRDGNKTYFVHYQKNTWSQSEFGIELLNKIVRGDIEIINDKKGHYWKVSVSQAQRPDDAELATTAIRDLEMGEEKTAE